MRPFAKTLKNHSIAKGRGDSVGCNVMNKNLTRTEDPVGRGRRAELLQHGGVVLWLTGLSGSGKSTLAVQAQERLHLRGMAAFILDGDNLRHGLCSNLSFSPDDRSENIRRVGEVAKLMADAGLVVICSLISPYQADRQRVRETCQRDGIPFAEVFVNTPLAVCEARDPRGLYAKARSGEIREFTGISAPYEVPESPELELHTEEMSAKECLEALMELALRLAKSYPSHHHAGAGFGI